MIFEFLSTSLILTFTLGLLWILKYFISVREHVKKFAHIPGPEPLDIKGFLFGNTPTFVEYQNKGVYIRQYLASL
jgi:hypothetical protein